MRSSVNAGKTKGGEKSFFEIPVRKGRLANGLIFLLNRNPAAPLVACYWGIPAGSRHEKKGKTGMAHMFEHMMFRGTQKNPDIENLYLENGVIELNAHTYYDWTGYHFKHPARKLSLVLDAEADRIARLHLTQKALDTERKAVQEERALSLENNPYGALHEAMMKLVFKKSPYRHPILGEKKDIASYQLKDLRQWRKNFYRPQNIVLALSGPFDEEEAARQIEKYFSPLTNSGGAPPESLAEPIEKPLTEPLAEPLTEPLTEPEQSEERSLFLKQEIQTQEIRMTFRGPGEGTKECLALEALSHILGGGESSRLFKKAVREKPLLPDIGAGMITFAKHSLFLVFFALPDKVSESRLKNLVLEELQKTREKAVTKRELEKAKNILLLDQVNSLKTAAGRALETTHYEMLQGDFQKLFQQPKEIQSLTADSLVEAAAKYLLPSRLCYIKTARRQNAGNGRNI